MQFQVVSAVDEVIGFPALPGAIAAGGTEAMQDGEKDGAFNIEVVVAVSEKLADDGLAAGLLPEALKDEAGPDAAGADGRGLAIAMGSQE